MARQGEFFLAVLVMAVVAGTADAYRQLHLCNGSGRRYCANSHRAVRCPRTCRPENCVRRPTGADGAFYTRCYQIRPPICQTIYWEEIAATNMYDYVYLNTTMNQDDGELCYSTCREEPFRGVCLASERGINGVDYCKQIDCRRLKMPNQSGCHQPRDFHAPTCSECEIIFPLACGSNEGGVLKGWKSLLAERERTKDRQAAIAYNASTVEYAKFMNSSFEDVYRWLNGAAVPKVPDWFTCSKMHNERLSFLQDLQAKEIERVNQRESALPPGLEAQLINDTFGNAPAAANQLPTFTNFNPCTTGESSDCPDVADLVSSEGLPYSPEWEANNCKRYYEHELKTFNAGEEDESDESEDTDGFVGTLDWLPPWSWEPWNNNWEPLPQGQQWFWETLDVEVQMNADGSGKTALDSFQDTLDAVKSHGSVVRAIHDSNDIALAASDVAIQSNAMPNVVQVVFQLSDNADNPFEENEAALIRAIAFVSNVSPDTVEVTETFRDFTQELATVSVTITTEDPLAVSIAFARADRSGQLAATLAAADFNYLEVSMTSTVAFSHEIQEAMELEDAVQEMEKKEKKSTMIYLVGGAVAVLVAGVGGLAVMLVIIRKRRAAADAAEAKAEATPSKSAASAAVEESETISTRT